MNIVHAASNAVDISGGILQKDPVTGVVNLGSIANGILGLMVSLAYPLAFIAILYSAYILISSVGKPEAFVTAKKNIVFLCIGIFLIVFSAAFVRFTTSIFSEVAPSESSVVKSDPSPEEPPTVADVPPEEPVGVADLLIHSCDDSEYPKEEVKTYTLLGISTAKAASACALGKLRIPNPHTYLGLENHIIPPLLTGSHMNLGSPASSPINPYKSIYSTTSTTNQSGVCNKNYWECQVSFCTPSSKCDPVAEMYYVVERWPYIPIGNEKKTLWPYKGRRVIIHSEDTKMNVIASILDWGPGNDAWNKGIHAGASAEVFTKLKLTNKGAAYNVGAKKRNLVDMCFLANTLSEREFQPGEAWRSDKNPCK